MQAVNHSATSRCTYTSEVIQVYWNCLGGWVPRVCTLEVAVQPRTGHKRWRSIIKGEVLDGDLRLPMATSYVSPGWRLQPSAELTLRTPDLNLQLSNHKILLFLIYDCNSSWHWSPDIFINEANLYPRIFDQTARCQTSDDIDFSPTQNLSVYTQLFTSTNAPVRLNFFSVFLRASRPEELFKLDLMTN